MTAFYFDQAADMPDHLVTNRGHRALHMEYRGFHLRAEKIMNYTGRFFAEPAEKDLRDVDIQKINFASSLSEPAEVHSAYFSREINRTGALGAFTLAYDEREFEEWAEGAKKRIDQFLDDRAKA